ncbi:hypothetical protein [Actinomadura sp. 6N118]|uniref:hypothetical protein n=1 Tax=Actinomadura sp. 6N118 TaxID=3375151 RepID=UPI00378A74E6
MRPVAGMQCGCDNLGVMRMAAAVLVLATALGCSAPEAAGPDVTPPTLTSSGSSRPTPSPSLVENNGTLESPLSDFKASVLGVSWATTLTDPQNGTTKPEGRYLLVRLALRNITKHPTHPPAHLSLHTADASEYAPEWDQTFGQTVLVGRGKVNDLNPGARTTIVLVYDIPAGTKPKAVADLKL